MVHMQRGSEMQNRDVSALVESSRLRVTDECERPPEIITIGDSVIGTLGNFSGCTGKAKSKKTFNVCAIVAAAMVNGEVLRYRVNLPEDKRKVIYIDTEQSPFHCIKVMQRIISLAGLPSGTHPENLDFLALRKYAPMDRIDIIERVIYETEGLGLVIIDGIRDLALDINSPTEATNLITKLMQWTDEKQIHIHTVLHQNKGDEHSRGHIGTELNNKAETILQVVKDSTDSDISVVSSVHIRAMEFEKFAFQINGLGLPELVENYELTASSVRGFKYNELTEQQHRTALQATFNSREEYGYNDLIEALREGYGSIGYSYGRNKMTELKTFLVNKRMIVKSGKCYRYNPEFHY
ncbi:MAG: AAA family ATPase [Rikenellaceae bacterium]